jgi:hypothetical protein
LAHLPGGEIEVIPIQKLFEKKCEQIFLLQRQADKAAGALSRLQDEIKSSFNCTNLQQMRKLQTKLTADLENLSTRLQQMIYNFNLRFPNLGEET